MILDYFFGRTPSNMSYTECKPSNMEPLFNGIGVAGLLFDKYVKEYGTIICPHIQTQLYGRSFYFSDEEDMAKFEKAGGHSNSNKSACHIVGNASRWVMEILLEKGAVEH